jgi:hypothetical protein
MGAQQNSQYIKAKSRIALQTHREIVKKFQQEQGFAKLD